MLLKVILKVFLSGVIILILDVSGNFILNKMNVDKSIWSKGINGIVGMTFITIFITFVFIVMWTKL